MSERMTSIHLPGVSISAGWADYGRKTIDEMIALVRSRAEAMKADAELILAAADSDFRVKTYRGILVQRDCVVLQEGRKP